jgi:hypothetical protein
MTSIDRKTYDFGDYDYSYLGYINEQHHSDQEENKSNRRKGRQNNVNDRLCQI